MSMETSSTSLAPQISPVNKSGSSRDSSAVSRRPAGNISPFAPQTNIDIKSSVADMAGILSKISQEQQSTENNLSPQIQKILNQILEQSFSLEATLSNGLGSTVESQRFSVDQMLTLARMLSQLGNLSEQGAVQDLDESLQALLKNLKQFFSEQNNNAFEPALLHKFSFELLNGNDLDQVSPELAQFLKDSGSDAAAKAEKDNPELAKAKQSATLLKEILSQKSNGTEASSGRQANFSANQLRQPDSSSAQSQIPAQKPAREEGGDTSARSAVTQPPSQEEQSVLQDKLSPRIFRQNASDKTDGQLQNSRQLPSEAAENEMPDGKAATSRTMEHASEESALTRNKTYGSDSDNSHMPSSKTCAEEPATAAKEGLPVKNFFATDSPDEALQKQFKENMKQAGVSDEQLNRQQENTPAQNGQLQAKNNTEMLSMKNTVETMQNLKSLAALLIKDGNLTEKDTALLQNFINQRQEVLSESDAKQLQMLLRLCQSNVPAAVRQAAGQYNLPELTRLWAFMQLCDLSELKDKDAKNLRQASKKVYDFASMVKSSMTSQNVHSNAGTRSMDFMMPLYLGDHEKVPYPTYLHVYDESQPDPENPRMQKKETWLRLCLLTENIGAVDMTFRIYNENNLDVRVLFSDMKAVEDFKQYVPEFKKSFDDSALNLSDFNVSMAGAKV